MSAAKHDFAVPVLICSRVVTKILTHLLLVQQIFHFTMTGIQGKSKFKSDFPGSIHCPSAFSHQFLLVNQLGSSNSLPVSFTVLCPVLQETDNSPGSRRHKTNLTKTSLGSKKRVASISLVGHNKHFLWQTSSAGTEQKVFHISLNQCTLLGQISFASKTYSNTTACCIF